MSPSQVFVLSVILSENRHLLFKDHALAFLKKRKGQCLRSPFGPSPGGAQARAAAPVGEEQRRAIMSPLPCLER